MSFLFEILILGILVGGSYAGIKLGFVNIAAKPLKVVASFFFAYALCSVVGKGLIAPMIQAPITNYIKAFMYENCANLNPDNVLEEVPTLIKMAGAVLNDGVSISAGQTTDQIIETVITSYTKPFAELVSVIFAFVILFFVGKLLIMLGIYLVNSFCSNGVLSKVNRSMGFVLAGFLSILAAWAFVSVTNFFFHLPIFDGSATIRAFHGGLLYRLFNSLSPLELLLSF